MKNPTSAVNDGCTFLCLVRLQYEPLHATPSETLLDEKKMEVFASPLILQFYVLIS